MVKQHVVLRIEESHVFFVPRCGFGLTKFVGYRAVFQIQGSLQGRSSANRRVAVRTRRIGTVRGDLGRFNLDFKLPSQVLKGGNHQHEHVPLYIENPILLNAPQWKRR